MLFGNYRELSILSCRTSIIWAAVLLLMGAHNQVGAALFPSGLFTHFLARCPFQLYSVCPRVCELLTAVEVINQLMSKTNWIFINSALSSLREGKYHRRPSEFSSCQLGVWNARRIIGSYQNSLNSFGAQRGNWHKAINFKAHGQRLVGVSLLCSHNI